MASLLEDAKRLFKTDNLYAILGCSESCTQAEIKRAFYKCSLKYHPDRHEEGSKNHAKEQFQVIAKAFSILSDKDARAAYDETGIIGESFSEKSFQDWVDYFNLIFPKVTIKDYEELKKKYVGSDEEKKDIARYYERFKGDMDKIMECVFFADVFDEDRYRDIIQNLIDNKIVKAYNAFVNESTRKRANRLKRARKEAAEVERHSKKEKSLKKEDSMDSLILAIQTNREKRLKAADDLIENLTAKYCQSTKKSARKSNTAKK